MKQGFLSFRRFILQLVLGLCPVCAVASQDSIPNGFRVQNLDFKGTKVVMLIKSELSQELKKKPILLFIQGSLAIPLVLYDSQGPFDVFPFETSKLLKSFHLVILSKPAIPLWASMEKLSNEMNYIDPLTKHPPDTFLKFNTLDYYSKRNSHVINWLSSQCWVDKGGIVLAGHSEGSTIAAVTASLNKSVTHLIYLSGNPYGRMSTIIAQNRLKSAKDGRVEEAFEYWKERQAGNIIVAEDQGHYRDFSELLLDLKIPVLYQYGSRDPVCPYMDLFRLQAYKSKKRLQRFRCYEGAGHNFSASPGDDPCSWDIISEEWLGWYKQDL